MPPKVKSVITVAIFGYAQKRDTVHNRNFTPFPAYLKELFQHKTKHNFEKAKLETEIFFYEHDKKVFVIISTYIVTIVKL